jgi:hypothetical protein
MNPIVIVALFFGAVICFFGYPMIHSAIRLWGFLTGGVFLTVIAVGLFKMPGGLTQLTLQMGITFLVGGVLGAIAAGPLSALIIFISGTAMGWMLGAYVYPFLTHRPEITIMTVSLALITGLLSVRFQEVVMILSTAFIGALMLGYGTSLVMSIDALPLAIVFFAFMFFGAAAQYKSVHPESSWLRF